MPTSRDGHEVGAVIADFLEDAETGRVRRADGAPYGRDELRTLRGALSHVAAELGPQDVGAITDWEVQSLIGRLEDAGLPPQRIGVLVEALGSLYAYAIGRGLATTSPGLAVRDDGMPQAETPSPEARAPTEAVLLLGERVATGTIRATMLAFLLLALLLGVALV